jgi:hypothetical protein
MPQQNCLLYNMYARILKWARFPLRQLTTVTESTVRAVVHAQRNASEIPLASLLFPADLTVLMMLSGDAVLLLDYRLESLVAAL